MNLTKAFDTVSHDGQAKEDLPDSIYICFRTDSSLFSLQRLLARMKSIEELITDLLFADDCALLGNMEAALQHIVSRISGASPIA